MKKLLILSFILISTILIAEPVELTITPPRVVYNYFYPAYIDPENPQNQPILFWVEAINNTEEDISNYEIIFNLTWRDYDLVTNVIVKPNDVGPYWILLAGGKFRLNSQDIIVSGEYNNFCAEGFEFDDIMDNCPEFEDLVLRLGYFPDGDYVMTIQMFESDRMELSAPATFTFSVITPTAISLISPGNPMGLGPVSISDRYPIFLWFSNLTEFTLKIYECISMESSPEEIEMQSDLILEENITNSIVFSYPTDAYPLRYGKVYAWQVSSDIITPMKSKEEEIKSSMYLFTLSEEEFGNQEEQILINFLTQLNIEGLDELILLLEKGYSCEKLVWEGREISVNELNDILEKVISGEKKVKSVLID